MDENNENQGRIVGEGGYHVTAMAEVGAAVIDMAAGGTMQASVPVVSITFMDTNGDTYTAALSPTMASNVAAAVVRAGEQATTLVEGDTGAHLPNGAAATQSARPGN
jgi:hypothetical protein